MSEDSDIWEAASSDSSDSFTAQKNKKPKSQHSDSEKDIKLKLKKECSDEELNRKIKIKKEITDSCNENSFHEVQSSKKKKKRKHGEAANEKSDFSLEKTDNKSQSSKKKKKKLIKNESNDEDEHRRYLEDSCIDSTINDESTPAKKKKKSKNHMKECHDSNRDSEREQVKKVVKEELITSDCSVSHSPKKKKKKLKEGLNKFCAEETVVQQYDDSHYDNSLNRSNINTQQTNGLSSNEVSPKKKKKKSKEAQGDLIEDKFSAEETIVQGYDDSDHNTNSRRITSNVAHKNGYGTDNDVSSINSDEEPSLRNKMKLNMSLPAKLTKTTKLSERIRFEEDIAYDQRSLLDAYIAQRPELSRDPTDSLIDQNDDVWLIRAPRMSASLFRGVKLDTEERSKVKLGGHTYTVEAKPAEPMALAPGGAVRPLATLVIRRRLPRIVPSETGYEPVTGIPPPPPTVTRHPLLGVHWEKAVQVTKAAAARLLAAEKPASSKRKRKREASIAEVAEEAPRHKKKRRDKEPQSWDSEKAIEDNLFNF